MLSTIPKVLQELKTDRRGVTALEYGLLAGLIAVALIGVLTTFSGDLQNLFGNVSKDVAAVNPTT